MKGQATTLTGGKVVTRPDAPPIDDGVVVIEGGRVTAVGQRSDFGSEPVGEVLDCAGATVLPGLMNCHLHLALDGDLEPYTTKLPRLKEMSDRELVPIYLDQAARNLDAGVTTVRDLHPGPGGTTMGMLIAQETIARGYFRGSRMLLALRPLVMAGGHGSQWLSRTVSGVDEVQRAVRENIAEGANVVKVMTAHSWGRLPNRPESWRRYLTRQELSAAVEAAHRADVPISAHSHGADIIAENVDVGFDSIEHGSDLNESVVESMAARGTFLVPTLSSFQNFVEVGPDNGIPDSRIEEARFVISRQREGFRLAREAGVRIAAGNDAGFQFLPHGNSLIRELELYVELGMSPLEAIGAATHVAAQLLRVDHRLGTLEEGKLGDVLVVDGDATQNIRALYDVRFVLKEGDLVRRTAG